MTARSICLLLSSLALVACGPENFDAKPPHPDWVIRSRVAFYAADGKTQVTAPPEKLRLWMPYVVGDIYGSPNAGEILPVALTSDLNFTVNLNVNHLKLGKLLVPTRFSQKWMTIEPQEARVARLSPFVLPQDGIAPLGVTEWLEESSGDRLMLVYVDRPARMRGEVVYEGRSLRFDIETAAAGYVWIRQPPDSGAFVAVPRPSDVVLAVMPAS